jgi:hypothetical protein
MAHIYAWNIAISLVSFDLDPASAREWLASVLRKEVPDVGNQSFYLASQKTTLRCKSKNSGSGTNLVKDEFL